MRTHEQELLALVKFLKANRYPFLINQSHGFTAPFTDHRRSSKNLQIISLQTQPNLSRRQAGWVETLQEFDFNIEYLPGKFNTVADILSRNPSYAPRCTDCQKRLIVNSYFSLGYYQFPPSFNSQQWKDAVSRDDYAQEIFLQLKKKEHERPNTFRRYTLDQDGLLRYEQDRLYVPCELRPSVLREFHDRLPTGGHGGAAATYAKLLRHYQWPKMQADVRSFLRTCPQCRAFSPAVKYGLLRPLPIPETVNHTHGMDILHFPKPRGTQELPVVICSIDFLSSRTHLVPGETSLTSRETIALLYGQIWKHTGVPSVIISDQEPRFLADLFAAFETLVGARHDFATARHQQTDGRTERAIQSTKFIIRKYLDYAGSNWREFLPLVEFALNSTPRPHLNGLTPFEIENGRNPCPPGWIIDPRQLAPLQQPDRAVILKWQKLAADVNRVVQQSLRDAQDAYEKHYNERRQSIAFKVGDEVDLNRKEITISFDAAKPPNLLPKWIGQYKVLALGPHPDMYRLDLADTHLKAHCPYFHINILRPHVPPTHPLRTQQPRLPNQSLSTADRSTSLSAFARSTRLAVDNYVGGSFWSSMPATTSLLGSRANPAGHRSPQDMACEQPPHVN